LPDRALAARRACSKDQAPKSRDVPHAALVTARRSSAIVGQQVARLEKLGAKVVSRLRRWVVMEAPTGQRFCVVRVQRPGFQRMLTAGTKSDLLSAAWEPRTLPTQVTIVTSSPSSRSRRTVPAFQTLAPGTWNGRGAARMVHQGHLSGKMKPAGATEIRTVACCQRAPDSAIAHCPTVPPPKGCGTPGQAGGPFQRSKPWHLERGTGVRWVAAR